MNELKRVRLADIAERAGVSKMTVSLALRGERRVSESVRARIQTIATELGYVPDPALSALSAYRRVQSPPRFAGAIAFLNTFDRPLGETPRRYYSRYFRGAVARGLNLGFKVEEYWLNTPDVNPRVLDRILKSRGVSAVIVGPISALHSTLAIDWPAYSAVALGLSLDQPQLHIVANNHFHSSVLCVEELVKLGRRRIGLFLNCLQDERVQRRWSGGYLAAQQALLAPADRLRPVLYPRFDRDVLERWIQEERPDAVITGLPELPEHLRALGCRIPDDVAVVMPFEDARERALQLAGIDENAELNGATAVDLLAGMVYRNERGVPGKPLQVLVPAEWRAGWSAPVSARPACAAQALSDATAAPPAKAAKAPDRRKPAKL